MEGRWKVAFRRWGHLIARAGRKVAFRWWLICCGHRWMGRGEVLLAGWGVGGGHMVRSGGLGRQVVLRWRGQGGGLGSWSGVVWWKVALGRRSIAGGGHMNGLWGWLLRWKILLGGRRIGGHVEGGLW